MATRFPQELDSFVNPTGTTALDSSALWDHGKQHSDMNDAVEALETLIGTTNGSAPGALQKRIKDLESNYLSAHWTTRPARLWPVANLPLAAYCADDTYAYGIQSSGPVFTAVRLDTGAVGQTYNFGTSTLVKDVWEFDGALLAVVGRAVVVTEQQYDLWRSVDGGATWTVVLTPAVESVYFLHQGICEATINGRTVLLAAEYNVHSTRTPGGANDAVSVWLSSDNGASWAVQFTWNDGNHQIRHIHAIAQDPITGGVFICCGDDLESRIVVWDGIAALPATPSVANLNATSGWKAIGGAQRHRFVGIIFSGEYFYGAVDTFASESGIWRGKCADLSEYTRVSTGPKYDSICADNNGWYGFKAPNGDMYFCTQVTAVSTARQSVVYGSRDGENWYSIAQYRVQANAAACLPRSFLVIPDGRVMMSVDYATGRTAKQSILLQLSDMDFIEDRPDVLSPVWFVDPVSGNDSTGTGDFQTPWKTVNKAITNDNITTGARVMVTREGVFDEVAANLNWDSHAANAGEADQIVCISGVSREGTILNYITPTAGGPIWRPSATMPLELEHLTCRIAATGTVAGWAYTTTTTGEFRVKDAILEALDNGALVSPGIYVRGGIITGIRSKFQCPEAKTSYSLLASQASALPANSECNLTSCILDGGAGSISITNAWEVNLDHVSAIRYGVQCPITVATSATVNPTAQSCAFLSPTAEPGRDLAGLTWAGTEIQYCASEITPTVYPAPFVSVTNHLDMALLVDEDGRPLVSSPLMRLGAPATEERWDYDRRPILAALAGALLSAL